MTNLLKGSLLAVAAVALLSASANAGHGYGNGCGSTYGGGYGGYGGGYSYSVPSYGYSQSFSPSYSYPSYRAPQYHNTTHYDHHAPSVYQHRGHFDVQPGHYDTHRSGHWHH